MKDFPRPTILGWLVLGCCAFWCAVGVSVTGGLGANGGAGLRGDLIPVSDHYFAGYEFQARTTADQDAATADNLWNLDRGLSDSARFYQLDDLVRGA